MNDDIKDRTFVAYSDVVDYTYKDFLYNKVKHNQEVVVNILDGQYKAKFNVPKMHGILVEIIEKIS